MRVLLVDPDPESRDAMRLAFAGAGDQVRGVTTLADAGRQLCEFLPDAVVVAVDFPESEVSQFDEAPRLDSRRATRWPTRRG
jgi:DNA-binding response OmpR family regulator